MYMYLPQCFMTERITLRLVIVSDLGNCLQIETLARITVILNSKNSLGVGQVIWGREKK